MHAHIKAIPASKQRYPTAGDWEFLHHDGIEVRVTEQFDWRHEFLLGLHELVEAALCKHRGISEEAVTAFDVEFEAQREEGNTDEPGDSPFAPYRREHAFAMLIERGVAEELDVDWDAYEAAIEG